MMTILGFGSLLSLDLSQLKNFRLAHVETYRRVFAHPASFFFQLDVACLANKQMSSLSVEPCDVDQHGFITSVFEVPNTDMMQDGIPSQAFLEREEEYEQGARSRRCILRRDNVLPFKSLYHLHALYR